MSKTLNKETHFGFETINEKEKAGRVQGVFNSVSSKYDVMNDVMSLGVHRIWKDMMMDWLAPRADQKLLDVAGGNGWCSLGLALCGVKSTCLDSSPSVGCLPSRYRKFLRRAIEGKIELEKKFFFITLTK